MTEYVFVRCYDRLGYGKDTRMDKCVHRSTVKELIVKNGTTYHFREL
jgi:hypothetical protein